MGDTVHQDYDSDTTGDVLEVLFDEGGLMWVTIGVSALGILLALALVS
jgi:hypothetical protein